MPDRGRNLLNCGIMSLKERCVMKIYSKTQESILNSILVDGCHVISVDSKNDDYYYLEKEGLIYRKSLVNRHFTYCLTAAGKSYLEELKVDRWRFNFPTVLSVIAISIAVLSLIVAICK